MTSIVFTSIFATLGDLEEDRGGSSKPMLGLNIDVGVFFSYSTSFSSNLNYKNLAFPYVTAGVVNLSLSAEALTVAGDAFF